MTQKERLFKLLVDSVYEQSYVGENAKEVIEIIADYLLDNGVTFEKQEWISVDDELPPLDKAVLALTPYGGIGIAERYAGKRFDFADDWLKYEDVIYWTPLPEPPEVEE